MHGGSSHSFWRTLHNNEQLIMLKCDNERPDPMFFKRGDAYAFLIMKKIYGYSRLFITTNS